MQDDVVPAGPGEKGAFGGWDTVDPRLACPWFPPETKVTYCSILTQVVSCTAVRGKELAVSDGSTVQEMPRGFPGGRQGRQLARKPPPRGMSGLMLPPRVLTQ